MMPNGPAPPLVRPASTRPDQPQGAGAAARLWAKTVGNPSAMIVANTGTQSVLRLVSNVILARLLAPSAFALMAITMLILTGITLISDVGIAITALREGELSREKEDKLWTMQLFRGLGVALFMVVVATPVGWLYHDMRLPDVLFALALMPVLQGVQSLYPILALGHRRLLPSTVLEIVGRVGGMVLSILVALVSPTVWSLVIGTLAGLVASAVGGHLMAGRWPRIVVDFEYMRKQRRFSRWIQASSTLTFVGGQIDKALFPFLFGLPALGVYGIASTFAAMPQQVTQRWGASVFYPLTTQLLTAGAAQRRRLMRVRTTMLLYTAIIALFVAAVSPPFFLLLYDSQYHAAAPLAQIMAIGIFFDTAESSLRHLPLVESTPQFEVWVVVARLAAFALAALAVYLTGTGPTGYALAYVVGLATGHAFMLTIDVRRGYLRPGFDLALASVLVASVVATWLVPIPDSRWVLVGWGAAVGVTGLAAILVVFRYRGLPSLPAEPSPTLLREAAAEEMGLGAQPI